MRRLCIISLVLAGLLGAAQARAYLSAGGSGSARASLTSLTKPVLSAPASSGGATPLSWTDAKLAGQANTQITYVVQRRGTTSDPWTTIASGPCRSTPAPLPSTTTSCTDTTTSSASLTYRVIAQFKTWTATSNEAGVSVRVLDHLVLSAPASSTAGATVPLRITAVDAAGATVVAYTGTVALSSGDPAATLPARVTFTAADAGSHVVDSGVVLRTAGRQSLTAQDADNATIAGTTSVTVTPAAAAQLAFVQQPSTPTAAGTAFATQPAVAVQDAYGNGVTSGAPSTVTLALTSPQGATLSCSAATTVNGVATFSGCAVSAPGTYTLTATSPGLTSAQSASLTIAKRSQTIAFTSTAPTAARVGGPTYTVAATASSGLAVSFSVAAGSSGCTLAGATVSFTSVGTCRIQADQPGNGTYDAAPPVTQSFAVAKGNQTVTFTSTAPNPGAVNGTYTPAATASTGLPVTITVATASASICRINATTGVVTLSATGTCTLNANQAGNANYNAAPLTQQSFVVGAGLRITSVTGAGGNRYNFAGTGVGGTLNTGTITITVCSVSVVPCPTANVVDANASAFVLLNTNFTTTTPTGVLAAGTYYAEAAQSGTTLFSPPFAFTVS